MLVSVSSFTSRYRSVLLSTCHETKKLRSNSSQKSVSSFASREFQRETFRIVSSCTQEEGVRVGILVVILRDYLSRL